MSTTGTLAVASTPVASTGDMHAVMNAMGARAKVAAARIAKADSAAKNLALGSAADRLRAATDTILDANGLDIADMRAAGATAALIDRATLNPERVEAMATGLEAIGELPDPVGHVMAEWQRPNGLAIRRVRTPIGVIGVIFESRPNVTADAGALCLKAGNAAILRGGSDAFRTSAAIHACLVAGLEDAGLPGEAVQLVATRDRGAVGEMLKGLNGSIDVIVPRGGKSLVSRVQEEARVPVFGHLEGVCHVYVHSAAEPDMARAVVLNAKMRRTGICGAAETVLIDRAGADRHLQPLLSALIAAGCEVRGDADVRAADDRVIPARQDDWATEYLDAIIAMRVVDDIDEAMAHIARYGSQHTDAIVTEDVAAAERFLSEVDSAIVLHNASTQFADGGEFGFGAEIGIATGKLHARGPVGLEQLTTFKYQVRGHGQIRP
jgi:glutamate-5-semialdehyde dehydrogenase